MSECSASQCVYCGSHWNNLAAFSTHSLHRYELRRQTIYCDIQEPVFVLFQISAILYLPPSGMVTASRFIHLFAFCTLFQVQLDWFVCVLCFIQVLFMVSVWFDSCMRNYMSVCLWYQFCWHYRREAFFSSLFFNELCRKECFINLDTPITDIPDKATPKLVATAAGFLQNNLVFTIFNSKLHDIII